MFEQKAGKIICTQSLIPKILGAFLICVKCFKKAATSA